MEKNRKFHIYFCVTNDVSYDQRVQKIGSALAESCYNVTIVGRKLASQYNDQNLKDLQVKRLKCFFRSGPSFYLEYNLRLFFFLIFSRNYMGICACDPDTLMASSIASIIRSKVLIYDSHEFFTEVPELANSKWKKFVWSSIETIGARIARLRYTVGPALAQILTEKYHTPFEVIRNLSNFQNAANEINRSNIILYQGVLNVGRGLEHAITAMNLLPNYQLWICGEGDIANDLRLQANDSKYDNVKFFGKLLPNDLLNITRQAKYGLNLLDGSSLNYYYSLANKFFDYSAFGVVSINMNFPEYALLHKAYPCSILIEELTVDSIVNAILNEESWEQKSMLARNMVLSINWESEKRHLLNLYQKILPLT